MLAVPPAILDLLDLGPGASVDVSIDGERLIIQKQAQSRYSLAELLTASDYAQDQPTSGWEWVDAPAAGREIA